MRLYLNHIYNTEIKSPFVYMFLSFFLLFSPSIEPFSFQHAFILACLSPNNSLIESLFRKMNTLSRGFQRRLGVRGGALKNPKTPFLALKDQMRSIYLLV